MDIQIMLSKLLPLFVYPLGVSMWLLIGALVTGARGRRHAAFLCTLGALLILAVAGNGRVADALYGGMEQAYPPAAVAASETADAIVVLGGALGLPLPPRLDIDLVAASDRLRHTARLYAAGKAPRIILSGGNTFPQPGMRSESEHAARLLEEWGVPRDAMLLETESRNTYENALHTRALMARHGIRNALLVTSALHMPRAAAVFRSAGISIIPSATDHVAVKQQQPELLNWFPDVFSLAATTSVIKEWLGMLAYRLRGWIDD